MDLYHFVLNDTQLPALINCNNKYRGIQKLCSLIFKGMKWYRQEYTGLMGSFFMVLLTELGFSALCGHLRYSLQSGIGLTFSQQKWCEIQLE